MNAPSGLLKALRDEIQWAAEGSAQPDAPAVQWLALNSWEDLPQPSTIRSPEHTAIRIDDDLLFGDDLNAVLTPGYFLQRNPKWIVVRLINPETKVRRSVAFSRSEYAPTKADLEALDYL